MLIRNGTPITRDQILGFNNLEICTPDEIRYFKTITEEDKRGLLRLGKFLFLVLSHISELLKVDVKITSWLRISRAYTHQYGAAIDFVPNFGQSGFSLSSAKVNPRFYEDQDLIIKMKEVLAHLESDLGDSELGLFLLVEDDHLHLSMDRTHSSEVFSRDIKRW